jgi:hypothetical protein
MTHLFVVVLVKKSASETVEAEVSKLLEPYDQQRPAPEHEEVCYCVGSAARHRAYEAMRQKFGTIETREAIEFGKAVFESDSGRNTPNAGCESCGGTGKQKSEINPNGKWDWWTFGGRWDRAIQGDFSRTNPYEISHAHELDGNVLTPQFVIDHNVIPAAIVTPDGQWHEEEEWKEWAWKDTAKSILLKNLSALAVGIDCHA